MSLGIGWLVMLPAFAILIPVALYLIVLVLGCILAGCFVIYDKLMAWLDA